MGRLEQERMPLEVFFRGGRDYIQGSLILYLAAEKVAAARGAEGLLLREAKFNSLMDHAIDVSLSEAPDETAAGLIKFASGEAEIFAALHPAARPAPARAADRPKLLTGLAETGRLCGSARYLALQSFDDAMAAVVELNKELHNRVGEDIQDIWFAGLRGASLAVAGSPFGAEGGLQVELMLERPSGDRRLTLSRVQVAPEGGNALAFQILFSYRVGES